MKHNLTRRSLASLVAAGSVSIPTLFEASAATTGDQQGMLASWRGDARRQIIDFVNAIVTRGSDDFLPAAERVAVFDNDGTMWTEQPLPPEVAFSVDRLRKLASQHPEWDREEPFRSALSGDFAALSKGGVPALVKLAVSAQANTAPAYFRDLVSEWLKEARHPLFARPYVELVYRPMKELLQFLNANDFSCYVVSAGALEFLRAWTGTTYGLPPDRVMGSTLELQLVAENDKVELMQLPKIATFTNGAGKAAAIENLIGRRPIAAVGNSDGDFEMLQYATAGTGRRLGMLIHHDDADREYAYDHHAAVGRLDRALDEAHHHGWLVVSMKDDWRDVY